MMRVGFDAFKKAIEMETGHDTVVVLSEEEYGGLMETIYLCSIPGLAEEILEGMNTPIEERIPASQVEW